MKSLAAWILVFSFLSGPLWSGEPKVTITQGEFSAKVLIDDDVFTVYHYGTSRRKPYFLPVTGPGGYELLKKAVASASKDQDDVGCKVFIASETARLAGADGESAVVRYGEVFDVYKVEDQRVWLKGHNGWVARTDIAPMASIVTRVINDDPEPAKDKYSDDKYDHPHHKGIWFAVDEINDIKFWMEGSLVRNQSVKVEGSGGPAARLLIVNHWLNEKEEPVLIENTTVTILSNRLLTYDTVLTPGQHEVHIGDTKEGMFAIRLPGTMKEKSGKGPVTNSDGLVTTNAAWGKTASWVDYVGPVDGHLFGVTLMDAPQNPWPSRYHVRDYGLFSVNPFGAGAYTERDEKPEPKHARLLKVGESLHFKYGLWVHEGVVSKEQIQQVYQQIP